MHRAVLLAFLPTIAQGGFEENRGQAPGAVRYLARGPAYGVWFTDRGVDYVSAKSSFHLKVNGEPNAERPARQRVRRYRKGQRWDAIPVYERVRYRGVYAGIDLVFYINQSRELEFDYEVAAGASPAAIEMEFEGDDPPLRPAVAFQGGRKVAVNYRRSGPRKLGFEIGPYDARQPLTIDPAISFGTYFSGIGGGTGESIASDSRGHIYITGVTNTDLIPVRNAAQQYFYGSNEFFIAKIDADTREVLYSTFLGSYLDDRALDITVDKQGNAFVTGFSNSPDFPVTENALQKSYAGGSAVNGGDAIVVKLDPEGQLLYATYLGGGRDEYGRSIAVDAEGNMLVGGVTTSFDFPLERPIQAALAVNEANPAWPQRDFFVTKLSADGSRLVYSTYLGSRGVNNQLEEGNAIAADSEGNAIFTGATNGADVPLLNSLQANYGGGNRDVYVAKISPDGELLFATLWGGNGDDFPRALTVGRDNAIYVTGFTGNANFPVRNRLRAHAGGQDLFVLKIAPDTKSVELGTFIGGNGNDQGWGIAVDENANIFVSGHTQSQNLYTVDAFQTGPSSNCPALQCVQDLFRARLDRKEEGYEIVFSSYVRGNANDQTRALALSPDGQMLIIGVTQSVNLPLANPLVGQEAYNGGGPLIPFVLRVAF